MVMSQRVVEGTPTWVAAEVLHIGAEAVATAGRWLDGDAILKERRPRGYRHPSLDRRLSSARLTAEARILSRLAASPLPVPTLLAIDAEAGWMIQSRMPGVPLFDPLRGAADAPLGDSARSKPMFTSLGCFIRALHRRAVSHGDLTTHNILWCPEAGLSLVDFGLGRLSPELEICGLDLQVLSECLSASHPDHEGAMQAVLEGYTDDGSEVAFSQPSDSTTVADDAGGGAAEAGSPVGGAPAHSAAEVVARFEAIRGRVRYHG